MSAPKNAFLFFTQFGSPTYWSFFPISPIQNEKSTPQHRVSSVAKVFKKISIIPAPQLAINLLMGSELAHGLIFCSLRIIPERLLKEGFEFQYPLIEDYAKVLKDE